MRATGDCAMAYPLWPGYQASDLNCGSGCGVAEEGNPYLDVAIGLAALSCARRVADQRLFKPG